MFMDGIKLFAKNEKELETPIHAVRIYCQDIGMEFGIEKCAMLVIKSGKRHMTDGMVASSLPPSFLDTYKWSTKYFGCKSLPLFYPLLGFSHQRWLIVFHGSLSECKSSQASRTLHSILADLNNAIVWIVSSRFLISKSSSLSTNPLVTVPTHQLQMLSPSLSFSIDFSILLQSPGIHLSFRFSFTLWLSKTLKSTIRILRFFCCWLLLGLVVWPRLDDPFVSEYHRDVCESHFTGWILGCAYAICSYDQI